MARILRTVYLAGGLAAIGLTGWAEWHWWEGTPPAAERIDPSLRRSPGGWRSYTFWHRGIRGGK